MCMILGLDRAAISNRSSPCTRSPDSSGIGILLCPSARIGRGRGIPRTCATHHGIRRRNVGMPGWPTCQRFWVHMPPAAMVANSPACAWASCFMRRSRCLRITMRSIPPSAPPTALLLGARFPHQGGLVPLPVEQHTNHVD